MKKFKFIIVSLLAFASVSWAKDEPLALVDKTLNQCSQIVKMKDRDVQGREIEKNIMNAWESPCVKPYPTLKESALEKLADDMEAIANKINLGQLGDDLNKIALKQSALALWATHKAYVSPTDLTEEKARWMVCEKNVAPALCKNPEMNKILHQAFLEYKSKEKNVVHIDIDKDLKNQKVFNDKIHLMQDVCSEISSRKYGNFMTSNKIDLASLVEKRTENEKQARAAFQEKMKTTKFTPPSYVVARDATYVAPKDLHFKQYEKKETPKVVKTPLPKMNFTLPKFPKTQAEADAMFDKETYLLNENKPMLRQLFNELMTSKYAPMLVTESLREETHFTPVDFLKRNPCEQIMTLSAADPLAFDQSKKEFRSLIKEELKDIAENDATAKGDSSRRKKLRVIKDYLKTSPETIGELLEKNPKNTSYAKALCYFIQDIYTNDYRMQILDNVSTGVTAVTSIALFATGVGSPLAVTLTSISAASSAYSVGRGVYKVTEAHRMKDNFMESAASGELTDLDVTIKQINKMDEQVVSGTQDIIINTLSVLTSVTALKESGKFLGKVLSSAHGKTLAKFGTSNLLSEIKTGLSIFFTLEKESSPLSLAIFKQLSSDDLMEIGFLVSKLKPQSAVNSFVNDLNALKSPEEVKKFLSLVDKGAEINPNFLEYEELSKLTKPKTPKVITLKKVEAKTIEPQVVTELKNPKVLVLKKTEKLQAASKENKAFSMAEEVRRFEATGINEACPTCPKSLQLTDESINHSLQHYPETQVTDLESAMKYARGDRPTSILNPDTPLEDVLKKFKDENVKFGPDHKALELVAKDSKTVGYKVRVHLDNPPGKAGEYEFFVVVCRKPTCNDDAYGGFRKNVFKEGDVISIYPECGPGVLVIPKIGAINSYMEKNPEGLKTMGTGEAKMKVRLCK